MAKKPPRIPKAPQAYRTPQQIAAQKATKAKAEAAAKAKAESAEKPAAVDKISAKPSEKIEKTEVKSASDAVSEVVVDEAAVKRNVADFIKKAEKLRAFIEADKELEKQLESFQKTSLFKPFDVYLSPCDTHSRARVYHRHDDSLKDALLAAQKAAQRNIKQNEIKWIRIDVVVECEVLTYKEFQKRLHNVRKFGVHKGVSFDARFEASTIAEFLNAKEFINYSKHEFDLKRLQKYFVVHKVEHIPDQLVFFTTQGYILDETGCHRLYQDERNHGRRELSVMTKERLRELLDSSARYLCSIVKEGGRFDYGVRAGDDFHFTTYNILRHTGTIWALLMQYQISKDLDLVEKIESTINYMMQSIVWRDEQTAYLIEQKSNEIKLGGNAIAIIALSLYGEAFSNDRFVPLLTALARGILSMQRENGGYFHIMDPQTFTEREAYRIVYYDGEATYALAVMYGISRIPEFLQGAINAIDFMIENDYAQYRDHWVAYAVNEVTKHRPIPRFLNFGLYNADVNLEVIYQQDTLYQVYLEVLMATFQIYERAKELGTASYLQKFRFPEFLCTIYKRVHHHLNGYFAPELAMFMAKPEMCLGAFFVKQDYFRIRIDDVQHFIGGYYQVYRNFEKLEAYREKYWDEKSPERLYLKPIRGWTI